MEIGPVFAARAERAREENRMSRMRSFAETHPELANQLGVTAEQQVGQNVEIDETPLVPVELENKTLASQPQALNLALTIIMDHNTLTYTHQGV